MFDSDRPDDVPLTPAQIDAWRDRLDHRENASRPSGPAIPRRVAVPMFLAGVGLLAKAIAMAWGM